MGIRRVAVIFDDAARPETTGVYVRRALGSLVEVEQLLPTELGRVPPHRFDLFLSVDDGLSYPIPAKLRPHIRWVIDTHLDLRRALDQSQTCDAVFAAQRDGAQQLRQMGCSTAEWLPLAFDPQIHRPHPAEKQHDVGFIGNIFPGPRAELLNLIRRSYSNVLIDRRHFEAMAQAYSACRIVFNRSIRNDINMRVFETLGCGAFLMTNDLAANGQAELFQDGVDLATYRDPEELLDKLAHYLKRDQARERIAAAGHAKALAGHTYRHRLETILARAEQLAARTSVAATSSTGDRDPAYYRHARPEILALIPKSARRVLDVGCATGRLGAALKARQSCRVVGLEFDASAAREAVEVLDETRVGDVESPDLAFDAGSFDAVVCGDVLEHLRDPEAFLKRVRAWLADFGRLIASVPNVRHCSVLRGLSEGNWTYESAGLLDRDHLRFFTRRELEKLLTRVGFAIERLESVYVSNGDATRPNPNEIRIGRLRIEDLTPEEADEFFAYQFLVVAQSEPPLDSGMVSIVILTHNQWEYTQLCLDSLRRFTDVPHEIIVVDNASTDGTREYLGSLPDVRLISNSENRGFAAGCNQGIAAAQGRHVVLLNNDTIVTTGWLRRMLRVLESDPVIGLVGPCSNRVSGAQQIPVPYGEDLAGLDDFAWDWGQAQRSRIEDIERLIGFCLLIRRETIDRIGGLDERFGLGCYEDDDYTLRAIQAGFRTVIAREAFIHHFGGRTFQGANLNFAAIMEENRGKFLAKWGQEPPSPNPFQHPVPTRSAIYEWKARMVKGGGLLLSRSRIVLSLCMIVRDSARTLPGCLRGIRPWVDEIVIIDTGSNDNTPQIAESFGSRLFHYPWPDSFAQARNESLRHARGEWLFWMDSDDTITEDCGRRLRALAYGSHDPNVLGYVIQVHCPGRDEDGTQSVTAVDHVKLFRNRSDLRFEYRIHEQILPAIRRAEGEVAWTELYVVHSGSDPSPEAQARKRDRDFRLLHKELSERSDHPFTLFNLGMTHCDAGQFAQARHYLKRSIVNSQPSESHLRKAYALLIYSQMQLKRLDEAEATCRAALELFPLDDELRFRFGVLLHELGQFEESAAVYRFLLTQGEERHFTSVDQDLTGYKTRQNLAVVLGDSGHYADAEQEWRQVVTLTPEYREGWRGLGSALLAQQRIDETKALAEELATHPKLRAEALLLWTRIAEIQGDYAQVQNLLQQAISEFPGDSILEDAWCKFLFEQGSLEQAEAALESLVHRSPVNAAANHNLGAVRLQLGRPESAIACLTNSLRLRPNSDATRQLLKQAQDQIGVGG